MEYKEVVLKYPELQAVYDDLLDLIAKYGMPKLGRWVYCKYCYKNVCPQFAFGDGIVKCPNCGAGLAPLHRVIKAGSYQKWDEKIELDYARMMKYRDEIKQGARQADGIDEFGLVPYICQGCKVQPSTIYTSQGTFCNECFSRLKKSETEHTKEAE